MTTGHALWPGGGRANKAGTRRTDVAAPACMKDCAGAPTLASFLPDFARDSHGNLAEQNRFVGAQHGADTSKPAPQSALRIDTGSTTAGAATQARAPEQPPAAAKTARVRPDAAIDLMRKHSCMACHGIDNRIVGPSFRDVAKKHSERPDAVAYLAGRVCSGGSGVWGAISMPAQTLGEPDAKVIAQWIAGGALK